MLTKQLAEERLGDPVELVFGAQLSLSHNSGVAFGVLSGAPAGAVFAAVLLALAALIAGIVRGWLPASAVAVGLLAGGAVANLVDRAPDGRVTDFIDLPHWPSFNVADIAITLAVLLLVLRSFRDERIRRDAINGTAADSSMNLPAPQSPPRRAIDAAKNLPTRCPAHPLSTRCC